MGVILDTAQVLQWRISELLTLYCTMCAKLCTKYCLLFFNYSGRNFPKAS